MELRCKLANTREQPHHRMIAERKQMRAARLLHAIAAETDCRRGVDREPLQTRVTDSPP